jgi:hypothetical protein
MEVADKLQREKKHVGGRWRETEKETCASRGAGSFDFVLKDFGT